MVYYYIRPNTELQALLKQHPYMPSISSVIEVREEGQPILGYKDSIEIQKLVFLAAKHNYLQILGGSKELIIPAETRQHIYSFLHTLLGEPPYTRTLFDRWWTIETIGGAVSLEEKLRNLPVTSLEALAETDSERIALWLKYQIQEKKDNQEE